MSALPTVSIYDGGPNVTVRKDGGVVAEVKGTQPFVKVSPTGATGPKGQDGNSSNGIDWSPPSAQAVWMIPHGLGHYPQVAVILPDGEAVACRVQHQSTDVVMLTFASATSGTAHLT